MRVALRPAYQHLGNALIGNSCQELLQLSQPPVGLFGSSLVMDGLPNGVSPSVVPDTLAAYLFQLSHCMRVVLTGSRHAHDDTPFLPMAVVDDGVAVLECVWAIGWHHQDAAGGEPLNLNVRHREQLKQMLIGQ